MVLVLKHLLSIYKRSTGRRKNIMEIQTTEVNPEEKPTVMTNLLELLL